MMRRGSGGNAEYMEMACELARLGARTASGLLGRVSVTRKDDDTPVTEADHLVQAAMLDVIAAQFPGHAVLVEETVADPVRHTAIAASEFCWVIDPIDGTRNFARGIPMYATSVALMHRGEPLVAAIFDASTGRLYSALRGGGAFREGDPLRIEDRAYSSDSVLFISSFRRRTPPPVIARWMQTYLFRNLGSICIHFAWLAAGFSDGAYAPECKLWDLAAGALLVSEAGGRLSDPAGGPLWPMDVARYGGEDLPMVAGTPTMHAELVRSLSEASLDTESE
ncbi:MAG: inositol monophosphatase [Phycisphaerae bacterium]|nr:inositol monophosphatase [Phycisphaerae bacterium]